jgi:O-antigen/teichoic acid export membrane protein
MAITRNTFKHAAIYSAATVLGKAVGFIMLPFYAHIFEVQGYGVIGMLDVASTFLMSLFGYSVGGAIVRFYHEESGEGKNTVVSTALALLWIAGGAAILLLSLASPGIAWLLLDDSTLWGMVVLMLVGFLFDLTGTAAKQVLVIHQRSALFSLLGVLRLIVGLSLNIWLILVLRLDLWGYFLSSAITAALFSVVLNVLALVSCGTSFSRRIARKIIRFEAPLVLGNLLSFTSRQVERLLVKAFIGLGGVGILEMGYRFPYLIGMLVNQPFMLAWNTKRTEIAGATDAPVRIGRMFTYFIAAAVFAGLLLGVNLKLLIEIVTPPEFWPAYRIGRVEIVTAILMGSYYHLYFGLYYTKRTATISLIRSVCAFLKIGASTLFIWMWGILGAAFSACIMATIQVTWAFREAQRSYRLRLEYGKLAALVLTALAAFWIVGAKELFQQPAAALWTAWGPGVTEALEATPLAEWKGGKAIEVLSTRGAKVLAIGLNTLVVLPYPLVLLLIDRRSRVFLLQRLGFGDSSPPGR